MDETRRKTIAKKYILKIAFCSVFSFDFGEKQEKVHSPFQQL